MIAVYFFMIGLIIGLSLGSLIGIVTASMCAVANQDYETLEN